MNLKKSVFGTIAGLALVGTLAAPAVMAQAVEDGPKSNTATASVTVTDNGIFDVYFYSGDFNLSGVTLNADTSVGTATGSFTIGYDDTKAFRPKFDVTVNASSFALTSNTSHQIPSTGFTIERTYNVGQTHYGNSPIDYGDIGYFVDEAYPSGQAASTQWTSNNTLDTARRVQFGYQGVGTTLSGGKVDVALKVPNTTVPGTYNSTLTLSVVAGTQP